MNNTINVYFYGSNESGTPSNPENPGGQADSQNPEQNTAGEGTQNTQKGAMTYGAYALKNAVSYAVSSIGTWTDNSVLQQKVDGVMKLGGYAVAIATNPAMGTIALATDLVTSTINYRVNSNKENATLSVASKRAGNVSRSRT